MLRSACGCPASVDLENCWTLDEVASDHVEAHFRGGQPLRQASTSNQAVVTTPERMHRRNAVHGLRNVHSTVLDVL